MDVALIGVVAQGIENHSLGVLRQALDAEGLASCVIPFSGFAGIDAMVGDVLRSAPRVCGVSLQTTESALAAMAFTRLLRERGYRGQIVVGGHVATLMADEILAGPTGVDVVVELAGEAALIGLARGADPLTLPGTRTRSGRGAPAVPVEPRAIRRERTSEHLGFGAADLIASRGCPASCGYCCVSTVSTRAEDTGGARHVVRDIDNLAGEIAEAAEQGVRAFHVMDDNLLPLERDAALEWVRALRGALAARGVPRIALSLQLRADVVTPLLADELVALGLVRAYLGIDGYSPGQLRAIGRSAPAAAGQTAIDLLSARGVWCVANALVIGPTLRYETIVDEIEALATLRRAPVHLLTIEARPGTVYHRRASARGLIEGGPLWPVYRFEDERTFLIGEVVTGLPTRLEERSVPISLYDLGWALGVVQRLAPSVDVSAEAATYTRVSEAWNADQIRVLRAAAAAARDGRAAIDDLLARERPVVRAHDDALLAAADRALAAVERKLSALHQRPVTAHARGRVLARLAMALSLAAACDGGSRPAADAPVVVDVAVDAPLPACADSARTPQAYLSSIDACGCETGTNRRVRVTFDANGYVTSLLDVPWGGETTAPLPTDIEQCILALLSQYCYPTLAGTEADFSTCHSWIA